MFDQVAIIGCGLIGSSVFRALKKNGSVKKIITFDTNNSVAEIIKKENLSDEIVSNPEAAVKNADLVLVATPLSSFESAINSIKEFLKPSSILTDTSSVKTSVDKIVKKINLKNVTWIPGHPVAGTEKSGPRAGLADLFKGRWTILTPETNIKNSEIKKVSLFWESMGSKVKIMSLDDHDKILSLTSHLPHVIAYNIVKTTMGDDDKIKNDVIRYSAGGLRDFTRIAASDPATRRQPSAATMTPGNRSHHYSVTPSSRPLACTRQRCTMSNSQTASGCVRSKCSSICRGWHPYQSSRQVRSARRS